MLFSWMMAGFFMSYLLYLFVRKSSNRRVKAGIIAVVVICLMVIGSLVLYLTAKDHILPELSTMAEPGKFIEEQFDLKFWQITAAGKMWLDYPFFGIGGGGYREYLLQYVEKPKKRYIAKTYRGMANVHNDFMQFLCEFGIVGAGLLATVFVLLMAKIISSKAWKRGFVLFCLLGVSGVLIHSLIDLPFRSPPIIISFVVVMAGCGMLKPQKEKIASANVSEKGPVATFVTRFVNFYTILFLFIGIIGWWAITPIRQKASRDIVRDVEREYKAKLMIPRHDHVTPWKSQNASPTMLRSLGWAKFLYSDYKGLHLLSARINYDLYRNAKTNNRKNAKGYLKEAFRSSLAARRFTSYADIAFVKLHTAILDSLGYILEQSWCLKCLRDSYPKNIRINLLVREYYTRRPYLIR
jgi:hypothetical protein